MVCLFNGFWEDLDVVKTKDPAATSRLGIYLNSPGMRAVWAYRRQHWLWNHGFKGLARYLSTRSRRKFGVEIHPAATIGRRFMIDHGMGIVIGETTIIGDDCLLYQGVTLGGTGKETGKRHPTLKNNVIVGVGASVLGNIVLEDGVKVGGGAVVVKDVPPHTTVVGIPAKPVNKFDFSEGRKKRQVILPDPLHDKICEIEQRVQDLAECLDRLEERSPCAKVKNNLMVGRLAHVNPEGYEDEHEQRQDNDKRL